MSGATPVEMEACLAIVAGNRLACLQAIASEEEFQGCWRTSFRRLLLHDRYYDYAGGELTRADSALRLRSSETVGGTTTFLTFKGPARDADGSIVTRLERELEWSPSAPALIFAEFEGVGVRPPSLPPELPSTAEEVLEGAGLVPIQERRTRRLVAELRDGATPVAELALDHVVFDARGTRVDHREVEIEALGSTGRDRLESIAGELHRRHADSLRPWAWSKAALGRALERLADEGRLEPLLEGEEITTEGYGKIAEELAR